MRLFLACTVIVSIGCSAPAMPSDAGTTSDSSLDAAISATDAAMPMPDAAQPLSNVHFIGRFDFTPGADMPWLAWPGTEIVARFRGTSISVRLDDGGDDFFEAWVDDVRQSPFHAMMGPTTYPIASGLSDGEHVVRIVRRTESFFGRTQFLGFPGATLVPSAPPYPHLVEVIGDSITCGYGAIGAGPTCSFDATTESEPDAYGAITARTLDVAHAAIAYSGRGVYRNYGGGAGALLPELFEKRFAEFDGAWDFSYTPDVVVVTLGTNDFSTGDPGMPFVDALDAFVMQIRAHYASAPILLGTSPMLGGSDHALHRSYLDMVVQHAATRGDSHVSIVDFDEQSASDGYGCDYHPSVPTQTRMGAQLATAIRNATGW